MWRTLTRVLPRQSCTRFSPSLPLPFPVRPFSTIPSADAAALSSNKPVANLGETKPLPKSAKIVIIGGGVVGSSVAYHLAKFGAKDVVLIESGQLGCGTTWHAAGLVGQMRSTAQETQLSGVYGTKLYAELESETGFATGFRRCGSLTVARTDDRMTLLRRNASRARAYGIDAEMVDAKRAGELWPWMRWDDLKGALWLPGDGSVTSSDLTASLAAGAKQRGVRIYEKTRVTSIQTSEGHVRSVSTDRGTIECDVIVNCGGQWARKIGQMAGVNVPLHSAEHFYIVTNAFTPPISPMCPVMRDPDVYTYYREWSGGLVMGGFEPVCKPCFTDGIPDNFEFSLLPEDWDHFSVLMQGALERVPALETAQVRMVNGPESFTPDNQYILGEAPGLRKFYVAAGFNSSGVASAGGAGKALAEWILADEPTMDLWSVDIRRFAPFMNNINFLRDRTFETLGLHYQITWPKRELVSARPLRRSPLYAHLKAANAYFGSKFGWERPNWFAPKGVTPTMEYSFGRQNWFPYVASEHHACRNDVALFDQSSFVKFILQGRDAVQVMQRLCCNDVDVEIGKVVYTGMLNRKGGMETDITVTRIASDTYFMVTSTAQGTRDSDWIRRNFKKDEFVTLTDVTSAYATLSVMGPKSRQLLERVSKADLSNAGFPFSTSREIDIGYANVRATRITYVGELGWELYVPTEFATSVYELLHENGKDLGLCDAGYYAIDSLRLEKAYRAWGHELSPDYTPYQSGLGFAVKLDKGCDFIGRDALIEAKKQGVTKRLAVFTFDDPQAYPLGDEPILRNGQLVGYISSASYGHTLGRAVGMGYVRNSEGQVDKTWIENGTYQVEISGKPWNVKVSLQPAYDPKGDRIKV